MLLINDIFWTYRVSAFRKDRRWERRGFFGQPLDWNWELLNPSSYTAEGKWVYRTFLVSTIAWFAAFAVCLYMAWQAM